MSAFLRLNTADFVKGCTVAILVAVLGAVQQMLNGHGLDIASYDWGAIFDVAWKATAAYLAKNLMTASNGKVLGHL